MFVLYSPKLANKQRKPAQASGEIANLPLADLDISAEHSLGAEKWENDGARLISYEIRDPFGRSL
jgi:hypothetical protein